MRLLLRALARPIPPRPAKPIEAQQVQDFEADQTSQRYAGPCCWPRLFVNRKGEYRNEFLECGRKTGFPRVTGEGEFLRVDEPPRWIRFRHANIRPLFCRTVLSCRGARDTWQDSLVPRLNPGGWHCCAETSPAEGEP